jgi:hypothetical protein
MIWSETRRAESAVIVRGVCRGVRDPARAPRSAKTFLSRMGYHARHLRKDVTVATATVDTIERSRRTPID